MKAQFQNIWQRSHFFRIVLVLSVIYTVLRILIQVAVLVFMFSGAGDIQLSEWAPSLEGPMIPDDLRIYLDAATRLHQKETLYIQGTVNRMEFYQYPPSFALAMTPFLWIPREVAAVLHTILHFAAYALLYVVWWHIFKDFDLPRGRKMLIWTIPVWLLFSSFWTDLGYLNVYIFMALLATLAIKAVLEERLGLSLLWITIILQIKPQWAFAIVIPLILGRWKFFSKMALLSLVSYLAVTGVTLLIVGPAYGWRQYLDYARLLGGISAGGYPWRDPSMPFLGYNHSIKQVIAYFWGATPGTLLLADLVKLIILLPLGVVSVRHMLNPAGEAGIEVPRFALSLAFSLYFAAFIWLDMVWELSLSIAAFAYLLAISTDRRISALLMVVFLPYALLDPLRIAGLVLSFFGSDVVAPGPYILTDPAIYVPLMMIVAIVFYGMLVMKLRRKAVTCGSSR